MGPTFELMTIAAFMSLHPHEDVCASTSKLYSLGTSQECCNPFILTTQHFKRMNLHEFHRHARILILFTISESLFPLRKEIFMNMSWMESFSLLWPFLRRMIDLNFTSCPGIVTNKDFTHVMLSSRLEDENG